jgi:ABC-type branched-subunit amino acid transport system substrate-binding protein
MSLASRRAVLLAALAAPLSVLSRPAPQYDPGADDHEIRIGNTGPYSGPASAYGTTGKAMRAVFDQVNAEGGVNGRRIRFLSRDDGYNPAKTVEQVRRLVEDDEVLLMLAPLGTAHNSAIQAYLNARRVPQLFINSGASRWGDPQRFPWTMGFTPSYRTEGRAYARHILATRPQARVAVLYQNDELGKEYLQGVIDGLGALAATRLVARQSYEVTDATVDSQVLTLQASGADVFVNVATPKFAAQAIRRAAESGWKPLQYLATVSTSVTAVLKPAGFDNAQGIVSSMYLRDPSDPAIHGSAAYRDYAETIRRYYPGGDPADNFNVNGYTIAQAMVQVLRQAGDQLTRANVMAIAAHLNLPLPMLAPGIQVHTRPDDFHPVSQLQLTRFVGQRFEPFGPLVER